MTFFEPLALTGKHVIPEPLRPDHHDGLVAAVRDGESREATARLGAKQDGVLRDTVRFSTLGHEWPMVRAGLEHRLARHG